MVPLLPQTHVFLLKSFDSKKSAFSKGKKKKSYQKHSQVNSQNSAFDIISENIRLLKCFIFSH